MTGGGREKISIPVAFTVNDRQVSAGVEPRLHLADFLRDNLRLTGTHLGCEHGICGACTVLINGAPARSCITYAVACDGLEVRTIEGFEDDATMELLRETFSREHGLQCGFCTPGMLITARDILHRVPDADETRVRIELSGNLCRCTGYKGIVNAVCAALGERSESKTQRTQTASTQKKVSEFRTFTPATSGHPPTANVKGFERPSEPRKGWNHFEESFVLALSPERVWRTFADLPMVAACMPGAELLEHDASSIKGQVKIKFGPIQAAFAGTASIDRDDTTHTGVIRGAGTDGRSGSRTRGEVTYRVVPEAGGGSRVVAVVEYNLQGPLAQFSRSNLVQELGRTLVAQFARNLSARVGGSHEAINGVPPAAAPIRGWQLLWRTLMRIFSRQYSG